MDSIYCDPNEFKSACSRFPTGVTVTTVIGQNGQPVGITVSSFTSVSLSPPLILVCIDHRSPVLQCVTLGTHFGVNILGDRQEELSSKFSRDWKNRFMDVAWYAGRTGAPLLFDVPANFECEAVQKVAAGDHSIVIGKVLHVTTRDATPLTYVNRCYGKITYSVPYNKGAPVFPAQLRVTEGVE